MASLQRLRLERENCPPINNKGGLDSFRFFALKRHEALLKLVQSLDRETMKSANADDLLFMAKVYAMNAKYDEAERAFSQLPTSHKKTSGAFAPAAKTIPDCLIQLSSHCNLSCAYCPHGAPSSHSHMEANLFKDILRQLTDGNFNVRQITLNQSGESLLHPDFFKMLEIAKQGIARFPKRPNVLLFTNGQSFDEDCSRRIFGAGVVNTYIWSIDGVNQKSYERIRKGGCYDVALRNLEAFLKLRPPNVKAIIYNMLDADCELADGDPRLQALFKKADTVAARFPSARCGHDYGYYIYGPFRNKGACCWGKNQFVVNSHGKVCLCSIDLNGETAFADLSSDSLLDVYLHRLTKLLNSMDAGRGNADFELCRNCPMTDNSYEPTFGTPLGNQALGFYGKNISFLSQGGGDVLTK